MTKKDFTNALKYGDCTGSVEAASPNCVEKNPGLKPKPCPYKAAKSRGKLKIVPCNCCGKCRNNCNWMAQVLEANQRESADRRQQMRLLTDYLDNE